jgi:beta-galactosidase
MLPEIGAIAPHTDPEIVGLRRLRAHSPLGGFRRIVLDGTWELELFDHPDDITPRALVGPRRRRSVTVDVPGCWPMQVEAAPHDVPHYTNIAMPFPGPPPSLPPVLRTGVYRTTVHLPTSWRSRRTVLHVGGAESAHYVYINGTFAGYGTDSKLPSEYEMGDHLRDGANDLAIVVVRYSAQSYVEDQDQWWLGGLHRSVWVESRPPVHLSDIAVTTAFDHTTGTGTVTVESRVDPGAGIDKGWTVHVSVDDPRGRTIAGPDGRSVPHRHDRPYVFAGYVVRHEATIESALPWSAETPHLYEVRVELVDPRGRTVQSETERVGVRTVAIVDGELRVNGRKIWIFGVNRHDHHPDRGVALDEADLRADLVTMRRLNVNAIRTSHYPNDEVFYRLCDELGFYVIDEANIESHAYNTSLCHDDRYRNTWIERGVRMVRRDRNRACVIAWSLGNESGYGPHHDALAGAIRRLDPSRPLHYEGAVFHAGWEHGGRPATDIVCPMYPTIDAITAYGAGDGDRPLIMCEYSHAMGNSNGSLADYWDTIMSTPRLQGGFVWEWRDHGLRRRLPDGTTRLAYGGMFGDTPNDGNFVADGIVSSDGRPHPAGAELAWVHRPVSVRRTRRGVTISNRRSFTDLADLVGTWTLLVDGEATEHGELDTDRLPPNASFESPLPCAVPTYGEVVLRCEWRLRSTDWFAPTGHLVAHDEVVLRNSRRMSPRKLAPAEIARLDELGIAPETSLWRAATDNDGFKLSPHLALTIGVGGSALGRWLAAGLHLGTVPDVITHRHSADRTERHEIHRHLIDIPDELADLPRVGVAFGVPERFSVMRYHGRGPHENYPDRNRSAMLGIWESPLDELPYLVPQEFGLRTDCRWFDLIDPTTGDTLHIDPISASGPRGATAALHVSATRHHPGSLYAAAHESEIDADPFVTVCLDIAHRGLGTASCGPDVLDPYRVPAGRYELSYRLALSTGSQSGK